MYSWGPVVLICAHRLAISMHLQHCQQQLDIQMCQGHQVIPASSATVDIPLLGPASKHTAGDQEQVSDTLLLHVSLPFIYLQSDYCMSSTIHTHSDHSLLLSLKLVEALVVTVLILLSNILAVLRSPPPTCPISACNYMYLYTCFAVIWVTSV